MSLLAQVSPDFTVPHVDYHALAPELVLVGAIVVLLIADLIFEDRGRWATSSIAGVGLLAAAVPVLTLAADGADRFMFGGAYTVDNFSLVLKALFLMTGYVVVLMSTQYVREGDYYESEYYFLLLSSITGMMMMASSRDFISMFVALEFLSIPAYMLAAWRKRDVKSNEAGMKYFLLGVFASAVMLYGMSLIYGVTGSTLFSVVAGGLAGPDSDPIVSLGIVFVVVGFAFKVSAVPFHSWAPDTYEGAPTPITAFLSVGSKAAGFVALLTLLFGAFPLRSDVWAPLFWVLAALSMTVGNVIALRQTNIVRMLAYSSIAQGGFILMPLAVIGESTDAAKSALTAVVGYLVIYALMNLGAFAVVMAVARKTRSAEISSFGGLFTYAPGLTVAMTIFLFSLAGIPPLGGWVAKFLVFRSLLDAGGGWAVALAVVGGVNSVIALYYYANVAREMWFRPPPDGDVTPVRVPSPLAIAMGLTAAAVLLVGIVPSVVLDVVDKIDPVVLAAPPEPDRDDVSGPRDLAARLAGRIRRHGPVGFDEFVEAALYDADGGFFAVGGRAGRAGDFLTSPEVGPLFGAVVARMLDGCWDELGRPDPFVVVDAGAGPGTLARTVLAAGPACAPALRYVLVERSAAERARHGDHLPLEPAATAFAPAPDHLIDDAGHLDVAARGPIVVSVAELPAITFRGVVLANELLDNIAPMLLERTATGWHEVRVGLAEGEGDHESSGGPTPGATFVPPGGSFVEVLGPVASGLAARADALAPGATVGSRLPLQAGATAWVRDVLERLDGGRLVVVDYADASVGLAARPWTQWLRTYRGHQRGGHPLDAPGSQDITCEVAYDQLAPGRAVRRRSQAEWLAAHGIDELVAEGRRRWHDGAARGDLAALQGRSRVREAEALTDPAGLGAFQVMEWMV